MAIDILNLTEGDQEVLDELVHDTFSRSASSLNNQGPEAQIVFLLCQGWTEEKLLQALAIK